MGLIMPLALLALDSLVAISRLWSAAAPACRLWNDITHCFRNNTAEAPLLPVQHPDWDSRWKRLECLLGLMYTAVTLSRVRSQQATQGPCTHHGVMSR
jgi:hypothetical protein